MDLSCMQEKGWNNEQLENKISNMLKGVDVDSLSIMGILEQLKRDFL